MIGRPTTLNRYIWTGIQVSGSGDGSCSNATLSAPSSITSWSSTSQRAPSRLTPGSFSRKSLTSGGTLEVLTADAIGRLQHVHVMKCGDVQEHPAADDGGHLVDAALVPGPVADVLVGLEAVPDFAVAAEVVECVDVGAAMGVQRDGIAGVAGVAVGLLRQA